MRLTRKLKRNIAVAVTIAAPVAAMLFGHQFQTAPGPHPAGTAAAAPGADASPQAAQTVSQLLAKLTIVDKLPVVPGYERGCGTNKKTKLKEKCVFGPAWPDVRRTGCDERNQVLAAQLTNPVFKPRTRNCKVLAGVLNPDPYSGRVINFTVDRPKDITLDHVFALERAWNAGAAQWDLQQRKLYANDLENVLAVDGRLNESKHSSGLEWLPPNREFRCTYTQKYLQVAVKYHLAITTSDQKIATRTCSVSAESAPASQQQSAMP
ncbi:HNH endonuclease family protein [Mycobacteroides chelonae]|uniref:HNH endonuclease family protein n=1 Tax=Mycobacteroides chelonae TaxID=1774 RepID=UPI0008A87F59|nr:HNH endonuclease family protein [Mycobacteroides chelonae]OHU12789.1 hypothetical protein BKG75_17390 [Mycobacteroides chelonae]